MASVRTVCGGVSLVLIAGAAVACPVRRGAETNFVLSSFAAQWTPAGTALSLFVPATGRCVWEQIDLPSLRGRTLMSFPGDCRGARLALSIDQRHAAVWFDTSTANRSHAGTEGTFKEPEELAVGASRFFVVDQGEEAPRTIDLPAQTADVGFDPTGRLVALTIQPLTEAEIESGEVTVDGKTVKLERASEGDPVLVHAFAYESEQWSRFETAESTIAWDLALGTSALNAAQGLGFRSREALVPFIQGDDEDDAMILSRLASFAPQVHPARGEDAWIRFGSGETWFEVWEQSGEFAFATGLAAFLDARGMPFKPANWPFNDKDIVSYTWQESYLLARVDVEGSHPRLYRNGALVWFSDHALATTYWPLVLAREGSN